VGEYLSSMTAPVLLGMGGLGRLTELHRTVQQSGDE
jgi:hypothetical protein